MAFTSTKDTKIRNYYFDISKIDTGLIRALLKTYEKTGPYVILKLFEKATDDYEFEHRISLTFGEIENLVSVVSKLQNSVTDQKLSTQPSLANSEWYNSFWIEKIETKSELSCALYLYTFQVFILDCAKIVDLWICFFIA